MVDVITVLLVMLRRCLLTNIHRRFWISKAKIVSWICIKPRIQNIGKMWRNFNETRSCNLAWFDGGSKEQHISRSNWPRVNFIHLIWWEDVHVNLLNFRFQTMAALGLQNYWEKRFLKIPKCEGNLEKGVANPRLTLANLSGAFLFLFVGIGISFAVFLVENMWFYMQKGKGIIKRSKSSKVESHWRILSS